MTSASTLLLIWLAGYLRVLTDIMLLPVQFQLPCSKQRHLPSWLPLNLGSMADGRALDDSSLVIE